MSSIVQKDGSSNSQVEMAILVKENSMSFRIRRDDDLPLIVQLLAAAGLPPEGLDQTIGWLAVVGSSVVGHVAVELTPDAAVLRSLVVKPSHRGRGVAVSLLAAAEFLAGKRNIVLRTDTIGAWLERRGYQRTTLARVPASVLETTQFKGTVCSGYPILAKLAGTTHSGVNPGTRASEWPPSQI